MQFKDWTKSANLQNEEIRSIISQSQKITLRQMIKGIKGICIDTSHDDEDCVTMHITFSIHGTHDYRLAVVATPNSSLGKAHQGHLVLQNIDDDVIEIFESISDSARIAPKGTGLKGEYKLR
jgi:hypothetical protein